jgi:hypothetical protein
VTLPRNAPCAKGPERDDCNSMGKDAQRYGYVDRFVGDGLK